MVPDWRPRLGACGGPSAAPLRVLASGVGYSLTEDRGRPRYSAVQAAYPLADVGHLVASDAMRPWRRCRGDHILGARIEADFLAAMGPRRHHRGDMITVVTDVVREKPQWGHGVTAVERYTTATTGDVFTLPQRGHGVTAAETRGSKSLLVDQGEAAMGPRRHRRGGWIPRLGKLTHLGRAAMGPWRHRRGDRCGARARTRRPARNGATASPPWRPMWCQS